MSWPQDWHGASGGGENVTYVDFGDRIRAGGSGGGGMEGRLATLEVEMKHASEGIKRLDVRVEGMDTRMRSAENHLATLVEKVSHLPGKGFIVSTIIAGSAVIGGIAIFQEHIRTFLAP